MLFFVEMTGVEHRVQLSQELPSVEEYNERRMGSSAVRICLAITEYAPSHLGSILLLTGRRYCLGITIPPQIMRDEAMQAIWHETNMIVSTYVQVECEYLPFRRIGKLI